MLYELSNQIVKKAAKERIFLEQYPKGNTGQKYLKRNFQKEVKCNIYINKIFLSVKRGMDLPLMLKSFNCILMLNPQNEEKIVQSSPKDQMSHVNKGRLNPHLFTLRCKGIGHNDRLKNMCLIFLDDINKGASN